VSLGPSESEGWAGLVNRHVLTRTVRDSAAVLDALQGYMTGDWYTAPPPARAYLEEVDAEPGTLRVGVRTSAPLGLAEVDAQCITAVERTAAVLESLGHSVEQVAMPALDDPALLESFTAAMWAATDADLLEIEALVGTPVTEEDVEAGTWASARAGAAIDAAHYLRALSSMHAWTRRATAWWLDDGYDVLLTPTCAEPPPELGDLIRPETGGARLLPFAIFTAPFNITGQPAMSVPVHWTPAGLPVGVQFVGAPNREDVLFRLAAQIEQALPWADRRPPLHA
jgi:amidase